MVKLLLTLILLAGVIKIVAPWTTLYEGRSLYFASDETNKSCSDTKEKQEQEQAFMESPSLAIDLSVALIEHSSIQSQFIPTHHDEPSSPPPNNTHS